MFTGLVQAIGIVHSREGDRLVVEPGELSDVSDPFREGESIVVNGCCLTLIGTGPMLAFDVSPETFRRSSLGSLAVGSGVNLERAMRIGDRFGGHIVQGHVDGVATLVSRQDRGEYVQMRFRLSAEGAEFLIEKGSVCIDGISLTVVQPEGSEFDVWAIPHTLAATTLGELRVGASVNVEYDSIGKWVKKMVGE